MVTESPSNLENAVEEGMKFEHLSLLDNFEKNWIKSIIYSSLLFIPVYMWFYFSFIKEKHTKLKVMKIIYRILLILFVIYAFIIGIYYFVDIPEFRYRYTFKGNGICIDGYSDFVGEGFETLIIPDELWGKPIINLEGNYMLYDEVILPSTFPVKSFTGLMSSLTNIRMSGDPAEWYEEDGVIYNIEGDKILYVNDEVEHLHIPEKIKEFDPTHIIWNDVLKTIDVSPENKLLYSYDNVLYLSGESLDTRIYSNFKSR